MPSTKQ